MAELTIVLPTYNEAGNVGRMVEALQDAFSGTDLEILVVDDASPDGTAEVAEAAGARTIVRHDERGLATAVLRGFEAARGEWVLVMDCDFQHPIEAVQRMWRRAQDTERPVDAVVGSRYVAGGDDAAFSTGRRVVSKGARLIAWLTLRPLWRHRVTDPMSGLFMVRAQRLAGVHLRPTGYKILLEVVGRVPLRGVAEVGFRFGRRSAGESKLGGHVISQYLLHILRLGFSRRGNLWILAVLVAVLVGWWVAGQ